MKKNTPTLSFALVALVTLGTTSMPGRAQSVPPLVNYQGKLANANGVPLTTGDYPLRFRIYDAATGGNQVWGPQVFNGQTGPGYGAAIPVVQGWFNVMLGPVDTNNAPITSAFTAPDRYVEIQVNTDAPITPRQRILSAPYAFKSSVADEALSVRGEKTTGNLQFYVSTTGNDASDGLTLATAKQTIQAAVDLVPRTILHKVKIWVNPGTYPQMVKIHDKRAAVPGGQFIIQGIGLEGRDTVRITGALEISNSTVWLWNLGCYSDQGMACWGRSFVDMAFVTVPHGINLSQFTFANFEDVNIVAPGVRGSSAVNVESMSYLSLRDDHGILSDGEGNPFTTTQTVNRMENFSVVFRVSSGSVVVADGHFDSINNTSPTDVDSTSHFR